jgi:hypothetical protein
MARSFYFFRRIFGRLLDEAHYFADATDEFKALGASVIESWNDIETLTKFSVQVCQSRFPVASTRRRRS